MQKVVSETFQQASPKVEDYAFGLESSVVAWEQVKLLCEAKADPG